VISACGRDGREDNAPHDDYTESVAIETLSILLGDSFYSSHQLDINEAVAVLNQELYQFSREVQLDVSTFSHAETDIKITRLEALMMAGESYDMFVLMPQLNLWRYSQSRFIVDIYTLIDSCQYTSREDFFTNALNAFTINEGLYAFPMNFSFHSIAVNTGLPSEFINRFNNLDIITQAELIGMFIDLQNEDTDKFNSLSIVNPLSGLFPDNILARAVTGFTDFNERASHLNSGGFASFLDSLGQVQYMRGFPVENFISWGFSYPRVRQLESIQYMFICDNIMLNSLFALFEPREQLFSHHIPLSNGNGELYLYGWGVPQAFIVAATGNEKLTWDFLRHLIAHIAVTTHYCLFPSRTQNMRIPIKRSYFESHFRAVFYHQSDTLYEFFIGMQENDEREERIQQAIERLAAISEMPVATIPLVPISIIEEDLSLFMDGAITAEDAALRMHNRVNLWLIE